MIKKGLLSIVPVLSVVFAMLILGIASKKDASLEDGIFSWNKEWVSAVGIKKTRLVCSTLQARRVFQSFGTDFSLTENTLVEEYVTSLKEDGVEVYLLCGEPSWVKKDGIKQLKSQIDRVAEYNEGVPSAGRISGIVFDVEPYTLSDWDESGDEYMLGLYDNLKEAYSYAEEQKLKVTICIPYWYEQEYELVLEGLIRDCCDEAAVMNYKVGREEEKIMEEKQYAEKAGKALMSVFEFQKPGQHGLTEKNTYYKKGINGAKTAFLRMQESETYDKMSMGYHHMEAVYELMTP